MVKNRLLEIRLGLGYKYAKDFAVFLGLKGSMYSLIENNKKNVNLDNAFEIAEKLNMNIEDIWYKE
ncbi:helix-turn-helix domain-containing protein [Clostridium gasigenes]|uniref:helix-turn-helix transcriptional regulator n=1 Tax=Clostridium gasigenes TaxID=94869 RepID=UPI001C0B0527|nr:helix-turn-helix transcriptional regulator [Clostridium gasigenes]MBU3087451.1 helix-turn-helix domain-containing protein [Clostridium gasigenes]MBU3107127.1 helix-turn-helix domain-containing protein [Clostridium gasigenes]